MRISLHPLPKIILASAIAASVSCVWQLKEDPEPLHLSLAATQPDTVPILPSIKCSFSAPIQASSVSLQFSPAFFDFYVTLNTAQDSMTIVASEPLQGNTRYVIRPKNAIHSRDGAVLAADEDSLVIVTAPAEHEPNNSKGTADALTVWIEGIISSASDTDFYSCDCSAGDTLFLSSVNTISTFASIDSTGLVTPGLHPGFLNDSLVIPFAAIPPFFVKVFTANRATGGYYDLRK